MGNLASDTRRDFSDTAFADIISAIEQAGHGAAGDADIRMYQAWISANTPHGAHLFAAWYNLGAALSREGDAAGAAIAFSNARALKSDFHPASVNLGLALETMGQHDAALQSWDAALQTDVARTTLLNQKARLLEELGRLDEAEAALRKSLLTDPLQPDAVQHFVHIRQKMCLWPVLPANMPGLPPEALLRQAGPLGILALTDDVAVQAEVAGTWIARKMPPAPAHLGASVSYRHARIRIGYLSSDFCRHAMSFLVAELFERHDRSRFEIYGYCSTLADGSDIRRRVIAAFDHHRPIRHLSDEQAARLIRDDEIDILIDLNGLTAHTRLPILRWRPAPVQATYLGFIGPVPLPELDYLLCDDFVIPPDQAGAYRPAPLPIAPVYQANDSKRAIGPRLVRADAGLPEDRFVLCCFSNHYKITEAMFGAWMAIMRAADHTVLWLTADDRWSQEHLRHAASNQGIAPERILFATRTSPELYMSRLRVADLFLDTFPYNAGTVASDAIRMGLPLVTLAGSSFASRMAGSLLHAIGARGGIAESLNDYISTATMLANDRAAHAAYSRHFTEQAWSSALGDIAGFTAAFEARLSGLLMS